MRQADCFSRPAPRSRSSTANTTAHSPALAMTTPARGRTGTRRLSASCRWRADSAARSPDSRPPSRTRRTISLRRTHRPVRSGPPSVASSDDRSIPSTRTSFSRDRSPRTIITLEGATRTRRAINRHSTEFARRSTGGALTRTCSTPSRTPTSSSRLLRTCTRTAINATVIAADYRCQTRDLGA